MKLSYLIRTQSFASEPGAVFPFFSNAANLQAITPPWLRFRTVTPLPVEMGNGTRIEHALRLRGLPVRWVSEIQNWDPLHGFTDVQVEGPFRHWVHHHGFEAARDGTVMTDLVEYKVPGGALSGLIDRWLVRPDLDRIFAFGDGSWPTSLEASQNHH